MNKRRNKSVTKTKHRVQKTKRNRRLNKNRSVKGIRGNNKTKVVGKRRNIVQRGGGRIDDLVGRIFELDKLPEKERSDSVANIIHEITSDKSPQDLFEVARGQDQYQDERDPDGPTVLYAACRLKNPSIELVNCILEKMKVESDGFSFTKSFRGAPMSVTMYSIIPNGSSNRSYPQHAAVQAAKEILDGLTTEKYNKDIALTRIQMIIKILESLKTYDDNLVQHMRDGKKVMMRTSKLTAAEYTPLMNKKNHLSNGAEYTAYDEYVNGFGTTPSLRDMLQKTFPVSGHDGHPNNSFERLLLPTGPVSVAAGSAGASFAQGGQPLPPTYPPPVFDPAIANLHPVIPGHSNILERYFDPITRRHYLYDPDTKETKWEPLAGPPAHSVPVAAAAGWEERFDHTLQKPFWYNNDTKEITWNNPQKTGNKATAGITSATVAGHPNPSQSGGPPLPLGWEALTDPVSGRTYYANVSLNKTQWDRPPPPHTGSIQAAPSVGAADALPAGWSIIWTSSGEPRYQDLNDNRYVHKPTKPSLPRGWCEKLDYTSGWPYYVNTATGQSVWQRPAIPSSVAAPSPVPVAPSSAGAAPGAPAGALPLGWKEMRSPDGRIYFEDTRTGQTQWERPPNVNTGCTYTILPLSTHYSQNHTKGSNFIYNGVTYYFSDEMNTRIKRGRSEMDDRNHAHHSNFTFMYDNIQYTFVIYISGGHSVKFILKSGNGNPCMVTGIFNW